MSAEARSMCRLVRPLDAFDEQLTRFDPDGTRRQISEAVIELVHAMVGTK
jgi:hypothetical protein